MYTLLFLEKRTEQTEEKSIQTSNSMKSANWKGRKNKNK